jgi:hypothetical protein
MDQHFLPQCYLNEFTNPDGTFWTLDNDLLKAGRNIFIRKKTPAQVCYQPDYYTLDMKLPPNYHNLDKEDPLLIEKQLFRRYENEYPNIIKQIRNRASLTHSQAELLLRALISIKLRNKFIRDEYSGDAHKNIINEIFNKDLRASIYDAKQSFPNMTEAEIRAAIATVKDQATNDPEFIKMLHLVGLIDRERNPDSVINKITQLFLNKEWVIYESDFSAFFVCTDNPGFCVDSKDTVNNIKFADCTLYFPLTPLFCLVISDQKNDVAFYQNAVKKVCQYKPATAQFVNQINNGLLFNFTQYVIAP